MAPVSSKNVINKESVMLSTSHLLPTRLTKKYERDTDYLHGNDDFIFTLISLSDYSFQYYDDSDVQLTVSEIHILLGLFNKVQKCIFSQTVKHIIFIISVNGFIDTLVTYLLMLAEEGKFNGEFNWNMFFGDLIAFFKCLTQLKVYPCTRFKKLFKKIKHSLLITKEILSELVKHKNIIFTTTLLQDVDKMLFSLKPGSNVSNVNSEYVNSFWNPYPTPADIQKQDHSNLIKIDRYLNIEQYMKYQFLLLKEDYMSIIRDGLNQYKDVSSKTKNLYNHNIYIYKSVKFLDLALNPTSFRNVGYQVKLEESSQLKGVKNRKSKRFLFGSLLLFSNDDFVTFFAGLVGDRRYLEDGENILEIVLVETPSVNLINSSFTMVEPTFFFEPYHQVLKCLKTLSSLNFSMANYLISLQDYSPRPTYLASNTNYNICGSMVPVCHLKCWPPTSSLKLDNFQLHALKAALTNQFTLIQGPPGTGKTFLGLQIIEILIKNQKVWNIPQTPILVICYTNHALDQFLEGVLPMTEKLVRIGGQSKSKLLEPFNLRSLWRKPFKKADGVLNLRTNIRNLLALSIRSIIRYKKSLELIKQNLGILHIDLLQNVMSQDQKAYLFSEQAFLEWLLGDYTKYSVSMDLGDDSDESVTLNTDEKNIYSIKPDFVNHKQDLKEVEKVLSYHMNLCELECDLIELAEHIETKRIMNMKPQEIKCLMSNMSDFISKLTVYKLLKMKLAHAREEPSMPMDHLKIANINTLREKDRWCLYFLWQDEISRSMETQIKESISEHSDICQFYKEACDMEYYVNIKQYGTEVIGITTTGAARFNQLLSVLKPKVVIIEEAAEILEAHTVISLTRNCQHVVMIGDHYQLRPSAASYRLAKEFNVEVSLFERLVKQGMPVHTLCTQRRMRPEIASLVTPLIYKHLNNHFNVLNYPDVKGTCKNLFFINHHLYEEEMIDSYSHKNLREADFLLSLCGYLIKQGYLPSEITILTTYSAQENYMISKKSSNLALKDVHITVVDNYQGEENNIILISLVRSNKTNNIGYLTSRNRMCVALTRAKFGLFIVGNMDCLKNASELWKKVHSSLVNLNSYGDELELVCHTHGNITLVSPDSDMSSLKHGGCSNVCYSELPCGHICNKICHGANVDHKTYKCREKCKRLCENGHACKLFCFEECDTCEECKIPSHTESQSITNDSEQTKNSEQLLFSESEHVVESEINSNDSDSSITDSDVELNLDNFISQYSRMNLFEEDEKSEITSDDLIEENSNNETKKNYSNITEQNSSNISEHSKKNDSNIAEQNDSNISKHNISNIAERGGDSNFVEHIGSNITEYGVLNMPERLKIGKRDDLWHISDNEDDEELTDNMNFFDSNISKNVHVKTASDLSDSTLSQIKFECPKNENVLVSNSTEELMPSLHVFPATPKKDSQVSISPLNGNAMNLDDKLSDICQDLPELNIICLNECINTSGALSLSKLTVEDEYSSEHLTSFQMEGSVEESKLFREPSEVHMSPLPEVPCANVLPCGHHCLKKCDIFCLTVKCEQIIQMSFSCGHINRVPCHFLSKYSTGNKVNQEMILDHCEAVCGQVLECGHVCKGTCSSCCQGRVHQKCLELCDKTLLCGHKCTMYCWEDVHSCVETCNTKCSHQDCSRSCKEVCNICQEPCEWACKHFVCSMPCGDLCNRPLCMIPCKLLLSCGHTCVGFCGEPCPPLCLECQPSDLFDPISHRFVLLEECGHVIEWNFLVESLNVRQISLKRCPTCQVPLWCTMRLKNVITSNNWRIQDIVRSGSPEKLFNAEIKVNILETFKDLKEFLSEEVLSNSNFQILLQYAIDSVESILSGSKSSRRIVLKSLLFVQVYLLEISKLIMSYDISNLRKSHRQLIYLRINLFLKQLKSRELISSSEFFQFEFESLKLRRMLDFFTLYHEYSRNQDYLSRTISEICSKGFKYVFSTKEYTLLDDIEFCNINSHFKQSINSPIEITCNTKQFKLSLKDKLLPIFTNKLCHDGYWRLCPNGHPCQLNSFFENQCDSCM